MTSQKTGRILIGLSAAALVVIAMVIRPTAPDSSEYPAKPIEMTVLFGSTAQTIAQVLAGELSKQLGGTVVAVDRPGGGGAVGYSHVKSSQADGYSIVWNSNSISTAHYQGNMELSYTDFVPIARVSIESPAVAVRADTGWTTLQDIATAAKSGSAKLRVGHSGVGSFTHVVAAAIFQELGIDDRVIYVPYDAGKAPTELLGRRIDIAVQWPGQFISHMEAGTVRLTAVTGSERVEQVRDVPTAKEQGVDVELTMWRGLAAPAGTPASVVATLEAAAKKVTETPEFRATLGKLGAEVSFMGADAFGRFIAEDDVRFGKIMGDLGLRQGPKG